MVNATQQNAWSTMLANGTRKSAARDAILTVLTNAVQPLSAYEIVEFLKKKGKIFNKTTIYRELETLKKRGVIRELFLKNTVALYEIFTDHHHHTLCTSCGEIAHVVLPEPPQWSAQETFAQSGFVVTDHSLEFFGVCKRCQDHQ